MMRLTTLTVSILALLTSSSFAIKVTPLVPLEGSRLAKDISFMSFRESDKTVYGYSASNIYTPFQKILDGYYETLEITQYNGELRPSSILFQEKEFIVADKVTNKLYVSKPSQSFGGILGKFELLCDLGSSAGEVSGLVEVSRKQVLALTKNGNVYLCGSASKTARLIRKNLGTISSVAIDSSKSTIYFGTGYDKLYQLKFTDTNSLTNLKVLAKINGSKAITSIVVDDKRDKLYIAAKNLDCVKVIGLNGKVLEDIKLNFKEPKALSFADREKNSLLVVGISSNFDKSAADKLLLD